MSRSIKLEKGDGFVNKSKGIAILAIIAMLLAMLPAAGFADSTDTVRLAGANRVETALKICDEGWKSATTVILASSDEAHLFDALVAAPLAGQEDAPILVTPKNALNSKVKAKLKELGAKKVYIVGALSESVRNEVTAIGGLTVVKLGSADKRATARAVAAELDNPAGTFVVGDGGLADALSVASYAAAYNYSIAITDANGNIAKSDLRGDTIYIVGGKARVNDITGAKRFGGADRYKTNAEVAKGLNFNFDQVYLANGLTLVDALSVAPLAAKNRAFVQLCSTSYVAPVDELKAGSKVTVVGGTVAVPSAIVNKLTSALKARAQQKPDFTVQTENLIQLDLQINGKGYDEEALRDAHNYDFKGYVNGNLRSIDVVDVEVNNNKVTLTLERPVDNQSEGTLVIDASVADEKYTLKDIMFFDNKMPTVKEVEVIGKNTVKVTFSEPIADLANMKNQFLIKMGTKEYRVRQVTGVHNNLEANITVYDSFKNGTLSVSVDRGLKDYAGFSVRIGTFEAKVVEDKTPPKVVGYKNATRQQVTLIFDQDIRIEDEDRRNYYHTNPSNYIDEDLDEYTDLDGNELTLRFSRNNLPEGSGYVHIAAGSLADLWDNENKLLKVQIKVAIDEIAPTVKNVEYDSVANEIIITFSEEVAENSAERPLNYVLEDEKGRDVSFRVVADGKKVYLKLRDSAPSQGTYTLELGNIEDLAGNKLKKVTFKVKIEDTTPPDYPEAIYYEGSNTRYTLYVEFSEPMATSGSYSVRDLAKYELYDASSRKYINLKTANSNGDFKVDLAMANGNKTVILELNGFRLDPDEDGFVIGRVADAGGTFTQGFGSSMLEFRPVEERTISFVAGKVAAVSTLEIEAEFDGDLDYIDVDDFYIAVDGEKADYDIATIEILDSNKILITLADDTKLPGDVREKSKRLYLATRGGAGDKSYKIGSESASGAKLEAGLAEPIVDRIKPEILTENGKDPSKPYSSSNKGKKNNVPVVYATYFSGVDLTFVTVAFAEPVRAIEADYITVNDGYNEVSNGGVLDDGTKGVLIFVVDGRLYQGDEIEIAMVRDLAGNFATRLSFEIEYEVEVERL